MFQYQGKLGKIREKLREDSGNFELDSLWVPCFKVISRSHDFQKWSIISNFAWNTYIVNHNYMVFHSTSWHLTLGGIERSNQCHLVFIGLCIMDSVFLDSGAVRPRSLLSGLRLPESCIVTIKPVCCHDNPDNQVGQLYHVRFV